MFLRPPLLECTQALLRTNAAAQKLTCRYIHVIYPKGNVLSTVKPVFTKRSKIFVIASFRNASDVASTTYPPAETDPLSIIPDIPTPVPDESIVEKVLEYHANGEPTFASLGVAGYSPSGLIQNCLEWLHISCDLPWYIAISIGTICIRLLMFPLIIYSQRETLKMSSYVPKMQELQAKINEAKLYHDYYTVALYSLELENFMKKHKYNPMKTMVPLVIQIPVFLSVYKALKGLTGIPIESMKQGGILWFQDLTVADPYHLLPVLMSTTMYLTFKLGADGISTNTGVRFMKYMMILMPLGTCAITYNFPTAIVYYWLSSNIYALIQVKILRIPKVATYLHIPLPKKKDQSTVKMEAIKTEVKGWKKMMKDIQISRKLSNLESADERQFKEAGQGPIPRTFAYDPSKQMSTGTKK